ncbi:MAG: hypothetical protein Tsb005_11010 [Gammaproteobacteria bacterium]
MKSNLQKGFTLIELVVVITVLGILSALALPRFIAIQSDARIAVVNGMVGALNSSVAIARVQYQLNGNLTATSVTLDGQAVTVATGTGIPVGTAAGIGAALQSQNGYDADYTTATAVTFTPTGATAGTCSAIYNGTTGVVTSDVSAC